MVQRKPVNRLGHNGITEIKEHPWLKYYPWRDLYEKKLEAPFAPRSQDNYDKKYCEGPDKIGNDTLERYQNYYKNEALNELFINYSFENILTNQENNNLSNKTNNVNIPKRPLNSKPSRSSLASNAKKKPNTLSASTNSLNKNSINNLLKSKMKVTESLYLNKSNNSNLNNFSNKTNNSSSTNKSTIKISSSISSLKTPNQTKNYSNFNLLKTKNKPSIGSASGLTNKQISATPYRYNNEKLLLERLPFIDQKSIVAKHISSHSLVTKKLVNTPSVGSTVGKHSNKFSSIGSSSTGNSTVSMNFLHRRSGSTNTANKY